MSKLSIAMIVLALAITTSPVAAPIVQAAEPAPLSLPAAMGALAEARYQVETCVGVVKARGDADTRQRIEATYGAARSTVNGMLTRVATAAKLCAPDSVDTFDAASIAPGLRAVEKRRAAICATAETLLPKAEGDRGPWPLIAQIVGTVVAEKGAEIAIQTIVDWLWPKKPATAPKPDLDRCRNIEAMVEAKLWPPFADIQPVGR